MVLLASANRDPSVFADPATFDLSRPNAHRHLAFSAGAHYCLGAGLARAEAAAALAGLLRRYARLRLAGTVTPRQSRVIRGPLRLPV
ncbi:cytochrome P450 [Allocatelliglobosispora scoriae]|uniref:Cytochrome P450 n=1 Tax=Allocatelliglobosispora scoriae TaxID=643052 RepID=A0A841BIF6_9ACTN|nr:cytochrome P450 [Allocatelliglobosispora scoriae]